jgi:quercetin dioxygenase-like cupin family protein
MEIRRNGSQASTKGPEQYFTGAVRVDPLFPTTEAPLTGAVVTFEPGARSAWHRHPFGQTLVVVSGAGLIQCEGGSIRRIRAGDVVVCPTNEKHWHGASPTTAMTHLALTGTREGQMVEWLDKVTDAEYNGAVADD